DDAFVGVGVVRGAAQHGVALGLSDDAGQRVFTPGGIARHADAVAHDYGGAPHLPGEHAGDLDTGLIQDHAPAAAVAGDHHAPLGVLVLGSLLGAGAGAAAIGAHADVGFIPLVAHHRLGLPGAAGSGGVGAVQHAGPHVLEPRHGLGGGGDVLDLHAGDEQTDDGAGGGHPVVGVGAPAGTGQGDRGDVQAVLGFGDVPAERVDLRGQGVEAVGLVPPQVRDAPQAGLGGGQCCQRCDGGGEFPDIAHVPVHAL